MKKRIAMLFVIACLSGFARANSETMEGCTLGDRVYPEGAVISVLNATLDSPEFKLGSMTLYIVCTVAVNDIAFHKIDEQKGEDSSFTDTYMTGATHYQWTKLSRDLLKGINY